MCYLCKRRRILEEDQEAFQTLYTRLQTDLAIHNIDTKQAAIILSIIGRVRRELEAVTTLLDRMDTTPDAA